MKTRMIALVFVVLFGAAGPAVGDEIVDGRFGPGALYRMARPTNWNGSLLLYAHGFVSSTLPVALPPEADLLIAQLTARGFAVAYSSFSENGWAVKDGAQRTHQLLGIFSDRFGVPARVYLAGVSMGGLIAIKLHEQFPDAFDGLLTVCGAAGGTRQLFDYYGHTRALFDLLYPGSLPGDAGDVPAGINLQTAIAAPAAAVMAANPGPAATFPLIDQTPVPFATTTELAQSIISALVGNAGSYADLVPKLHGKAYFDNRSVQYSSALLPVSTIIGINAGIGRFTADPSALNYLAHYYEPTGQLAVPMIMVSMARDPVVPAFNQQSYLARVTAAGQEDLLVQRTVAGYGHCAVPPQTVAQAIADLVVWVEFGVKPLP